MAVSNLTNTTWVFNSSLSISSSDYHNYNVTLDCGSSSYVSLSIAQGEMYGIHELSYGLGGGSYRIACEVTSSTRWADQAYRTITITGGTDVTNATLIAWLEANATQQSEPNPLVETTISVGTKQLYNAYLGQGALQKIYKGTSLIFNRLEANFETSDHNLLITSDGDVFNVQDAPTPSAYNVTISENNTSQSNLNYKSYLKIYDGQDTTGTLLIDSTGHTALQSTTVVCTTGYLYVQGYSTQGEQYTFTYIKNITGSITDLGQAEAYTGNKLSVASDGSFVIDTDYNYD